MFLSAAKWDEFYLREVDPSKTSSYKGRDLVKIFERLHKNDFTIEKIGEYLDKYTPSVQNLLTYWGLVKGDSSVLYQLLERKTPREQLNYLSPLSRVDRERTLLLLSLVFNHSYKITSAIHEGIIHACVGLNEPDLLLAYLVDHGFKHMNENKTSMHFARRIGLVYACRKLGVLEQARALGLASFNYDILANPSASAPEVIVSKHNLSNSLTLNSAASTLGDLLYSDYECDYLVSLFQLLATTLDRENFQEILRFLRIGWISLRTTSFFSYKPFNVQ